MTEALTIYVVVVSLQHGLDELLGAATDDELPYPMTRRQNLEFWLGSIHARAPGSKVLIVCTKADLVDEATRERRVEDVWALLKGRAYRSQVLGVECVSNRTGAGVAEVRELLELSKDHLV